MPTSAAHRRRCECRPRHSSLGRRYRTAAARAAAHQMPQRPRSHWHSRKPWRSQHSTASSAVPNDVKLHQTQRCCAKSTSTHSGTPPCAPLPVALAAQGGAPTCSLLPRLTATQPVTIYNSEHGRAHPYEGPILTHVSTQESSKCCRGSCGQREKITSGHTTAGDCQADPQRYQRCRNRSGGE